MLALLMRALSRVAPLLFGSGLCALVYQVTWLRELRLVFGASTAASAAVLAVFMGGLGVGGAVLGKRVDRRKSPLEFYALLEFVVAVSAAVTPLLVTLARRAYEAMGGTVELGQGVGTVVRLLLAFLVLGAPTFAMGGTLPAASKAVESDADASRKSLAVLYGVNTLGAVVGAGLANFLLIEVFGNKLTLWLACTVNLLIAVVARAVSRGMSAEPEEAPGVSDDGGVREPPQTPLDRGGEVGEKVPEVGEKVPGVSDDGGVRERPHRDQNIPTTFVLVAAGVVGFAFLLMELVWYRMLGPILGGSSYTFGLILAVALLGIGLGGAAYALTDKRRLPTLRAFAITCALEALLVGLPFALGDRIALLTILTRPLGGIGFSGLLGHWSFIAGIVIFPAAFVSGYQFPLLIGLLGRGAKDVGRDVGYAYAANTAGSILGSLAGGFGLLPLLTAPGCWRLVVGSLAVLGLLSLYLHVSSNAKAGEPLLVGLRSRSAIALFAISVASFLFVFAKGPTAVWRHSPIGAGRVDHLANQPTRNGLRTWEHAQRLAIAWEVDGVESSVALDTRAGAAFIVNGKSDGSAISDAPTQIWSGLLGALLHPEPKRAMVVGLGTGSTAGWLGVVPTIERVDVVEIEPAILRVARDCAPVNADVLSNPKVSVFMGDAREVLSTTRSQYDIIFSEPSNPYRAGISSLYTQDFYQAASRRLSPGGIFLQWMQSYEVDGQAVRTVFATLGSVFPQVSVWATQGGDMLLVASLMPMEIDADALRARIATEPFRSAMIQVYRTEGLEAFFAHHVARPELVRSIARQEEFSISTDDRNLLEFAFARSVGKGRAFSDDEIWGLSRLMSADRPTIVRGSVDWALVTHYRIVDESVGIVNQPDPKRADLYQSLMRWRKGDLAGIGKHVARVGVPEELLSLDEVAMFAEVLAEMGDERAGQYIERVRKLNAHEADLLQARFLVRKQQTAEAVDALERGLVGARTNPWISTGILDRAIRMARPLGVANPAMLPRLLDMLMQPFSVSKLDVRRRQAAFEVASLLPGDECVRVLDTLEPHIPWLGPFLESRLRCYERNGNARKVAALADVRAFVDAAPVPFLDGFDIDAAKTDDGRAHETEAPSHVPQQSPSKE